MLGGGSAASIMKDSSSDLLRPESLQKKEFRVSDVGVHGFRGRS